jgi:hypothetical protein
VRHKVLPSSRTEHGAPNKFRGRDRHVLSYALQNHKLGALEAKGLAMFKVSENLPDEVYEISGPQGTLINQYEARSHPSTSLTAETTR